MQLIEVTNKSHAKDFIEVAVQLYKNSANYIRPLDKEIQDVFNPKKNKNFKYGTATRWILKNDKGELIGRIAAFTHAKYSNKGTEYPVGGMGFFECINQQQAANALLDKACEWLKQKGMEAVDGPINFGDRDKWWGLMVEGFEKEPIYGMSYHLPYYQQLLENYGFQNFYNQYYYARDVDAPLTEKFAERHAKFKAKVGYEARHADLKHLEKYAGDFATVYNAAWAQHGENKEITKEQVIKLFETMKPVMDPRMVWFAYYKEEPIAMFINIPDINQYFKHFNGKLGLLQKIHLLWLKKTGACKKLTGVAFGVVPKYQALGIDSFIIYESALLLQNKGWYETYEMGWAGDWHPKMINIYKSLGGIQSRRMVTYRLIFDNAHTFERHPEMEYN